MWAAYTPPLRMMGPAGLPPARRYTQCMADQGPRVVWQCPWWRVEERSFDGPDGRRHIWYSAHRPDPRTVHMLGITQDGEVPLLRQWRAPLETWVWELPAGLCDVKGEAPEDAARRELEEETGWRAADVQLLFTGTVSPGLTDELFSAYLCLNLQQVSAGGGTGGERIEVSLVPLAELAPFLMAKYTAGELVDSKIFAHLALAEARLAELAAGERQA